jgi:sec-independent protein translocase protein TatB
MFDIGWGELLVIGIVALVVIGPKELPALLRTLGQGMTKLRRMASEFQNQFNDAMREAELDELKKQAEKLTEVASYNPIDKATEELQAAIDKPVEPSTAAAEAPKPEPEPVKIPEEFEPLPEPAQKTAAESKPEPAESAPTSGGKGA